MCTKYKRSSSSSERTEIHEQLKKLKIWGASLKDATNSIQSKEADVKRALRDGAGNVNQLQSQVRQESRQLNVLMEAQKSAIMSMVDAAIPGRSPADYRKGVDKLLLLLDMLGDDSQVYAQGGRSNAEKHYSVRVAENDELG